MSVLIQCLRLIESIPPQTKQQQAQLQALYKRVQDAVLFDTDLSTKEATMRKLSDETPLLAISDNVEVQQVERSIPEFLTISEEEEKRPKNPDEEPKERPRKKPNWFSKFWSWTKQVGTFLVKWWVFDDPDEDVNKISNRDICKSVQAAVGTTPFLVMGVPAICTLIATSLGGPAIWGVLASGAVFALIVCLVTLAIRSMKDK